MNVFYDHLINIHDLHIEFDKLDLSVPDRNELIRLADSSVHHEVFDLIMIELPQQHRQVFLELLSADPGDPVIMTLASRHIPSVEEKIKARVSKLVNEFTEEVRKLL